MKIVKLSTKEINNLISVLHGLNNIEHIKYFDFLTKNKRKIRFINSDKF